MVRERIAHQSDSLELKRQPCSYTVLKMQKIVNHFNIPLTVCWNPQPEKNQHGQIEESSRTLLIFDADESEAWQTLTHELVEWRLKDVTNVYREMVNSLIEALERLAYKRKEDFLESMPKVFEAIDKTKKEQ